MHNSHRVSRYHAMQISMLLADMQTQRWESVEKFIEEVLCTKFCGDSPQEIDKQSIFAVSILHAISSAETSESTDKLKVLYAKLARRFWSEASVDLRWDMLCSAALFYNPLPKKPYKGHACLQYFRNLADRIGVHIDEVLDTIRFHS